MWTLKLGVEKPQGIQQKALQTESSLTNHSYIQIQSQDSMLSKAEENSVTSSF